jgi:hypothetical protein
MKVTRLLFLILTVSCAALMQKTSYAALPQHASDKNHTRSRACLTAANRPKQLPTSQKRPLPRNAASLRQPDLARSGSAAKGGLIQNETTNRGLPARHISVSRGMAALNPSLNPSLDNLRRRGPNPGIVGGSTNSGNRNAGLINGTGMHRRR